MAVSICLRVCEPELHRSVSMAVIIRDVRAQFDHILIADWSARSTPSPARPSRDAIWWCLHGREPVYERTRQSCEARLHELLPTLRGRILLGFDFSFSCPRWLLDALGLDWRGFWQMLEREISDSPHTNNRFDIAASLNQCATGSPAPFWGTPREAPFLPARKPPPDPARPEFRACEAALRPRPKSTFQLYGAGSVGSQTLLGIPTLERLRRAFDGQLSVWPFEPAGARIVLAEVYPSCLPRPLWSGHPLPDREQVRHLAAAFAQGVDLRPPSPADGEGAILLPPDTLA